MVDQACYIPLICGINYYFIADLEKLQKHSITAL